MWNQQSTSESDRLAALESYSILDSAPEAGYDDLAEIAAAICDVPISLVAFIAKDRQWFKASRGLGGLTETSREVSFCAHTLETHETLVVNDAQLDPAFKDNPLVTGSLGIRFYAGAPIVEREGHVLGTVCVIDQKPRTLSASQIRALEALARQAAQLVDQRRVAMEAAQLAAKAQLAESAAQTSKEQLALAVDSAGLAAWYFDPKEVVVSGDERMATFFGLTTGQGPAELWLSSICEEDRQRVGEEFAAAVAGAPYDTTYRVSVGGTIRWLHARARLITRPDGSNYMAGICEDVTRERVLASRLARASDRLALAQSAAKITMFDWNLLDDSVTFSGEQCFGRPVSEFKTSQDVFPLIVDEDRDRLASVIAESLKTGQEYHCEFRVNSAADTLWYSTSGKPLLNEQNAATAVIGVNLDITTRKRSELALIQSEKLAAVGRLASSVAHEINNPLEAVTNLLFIARQRSVDLEVHELLDQADVELRRISAIASQTLRFHRQSSNPQPTSCTSLFASTLNLYEGRLRNNKVLVEKRKRANEPVLCFEGDLKQVLSNVVVNAIDAMPAGGRLMVRSREGTDWRTGRKGLVLTIADTGTGMDPKTRQRAFEPFYTTKGIGGSGLGLWVCSQITDRHSGRFLLRSCNGTLRHGTTVVLFIPFNGVKIRS